MMTEQMTSERQGILRGCMEPLLAWYRACGRDLPWRRTKDPYSIWVSEIMLEQTRVETVIPYYERFLASLPSVRDLAVCPDDRLMKLWEGLGYYSRVRHMREAASVIVSGHGGIFPHEPEILLTLPGIGRYTAGAIASIAFGVPVAAVDGNVLRMVSRLTADDRNILTDRMRRDTERVLTEEIERLSGKVREDERSVPGSINQGFMDLGSKICLAHGRPACGECPLEGQCAAHAAGTEEAYPVRPAKKKRKITERTVLLILEGDKVALKKRPDQGLLAGLYEYPAFDGTMTEKEAAEEASALGFVPGSIRKLPGAVHVFTHLEWHMTGYEIRALSVNTGKTAGNGVFLADVRDVEKRYAVPSAYRAYSELLSSSEERNT